MVDWGDEERRLTDAVSRFKLPGGGARPADGPAVRLGRHEVAQRIS